MRFRLACLSLILVMAPCAEVLASAPAPKIAGDSTSVIIDKRTQIPSQTLKPGKYSIQILDHLNDRMIIRVEDASGKTHTVFLAVPGAGTATSGTSGPIVWKSDLNGAPAMRGFKFPSGYTVEFVYPKAEAAALAKANDDKVIAVDPDSEGRPRLQSMSTEDLQMIHLWMLSLTTASPNDKTPAILAQAYQAPTRIDRSPASSSLVASIAPPSSSTTLAKADLPSQPESHVASRKHPAIAALPHTASSLPLIELVGVLTLGLAIFLQIGFVTYRLMQPRP